MLKLFTLPWPSVPVVFIDTETTGVRPGADRAVQVALVRFEGGAPVAEFSSLVNPGFSIPLTATEIHGITDADVASSPSLVEVFAHAEVARMLQDAQPAAYNAAFDRHFVPPFGEDWTWPWLDSLSIVRKVDRFVRGSGRHKLEVTCERNGIPLPKAHDALADAKAAGLLFYKIAPLVFGPDVQLGEVLRWQRAAEAESWFDYFSWLSKQPPKEVSHAAHR